ncbi:ethanolamine ammonia-lyase subunit EutC [Poseidonibacter antarcticus]|uniref:ethanolamine ammonia-lyase subunit EutC n=1 Tax=Poseidonibacter antarcticus TaxID=2478538 RepID=UPI000EF4A555|nr:ethanolamine ammonia-lyase subunit EutC [Poseidonibacter antarcticus]
MSDLIKQDKETTVIQNPWAFLREHTEARIGLGRTGVSIPTNHLLDFQLAHAQAQDAVHLPLDTEHVVDQLNKISVNVNLLSNTDTSELFQDGYSPILLHSQAVNRVTYLQRPDLGRRLDSNSCKLLSKSIDQTRVPYDLSIVIVDGLSSLAIKENAVNYIQILSHALAKDKNQWKLAPITIVHQGRVAVGDEVGEILKARMTLVLIGERPGLSSPDSLGLYLTYNPKVGLTDANRNCISNVRSDGLSYEEAVKKTMYLLNEARRLELSGVNLKDRTSDDTLESSINNENFLIK